MLEEAGKRSEDHNEGCIGGVEDEKVHQSPSLEAASSTSRRVRVKLELLFGSLYSRKHMSNGHTSHPICTLDSHAHGPITCLVMIATAAKAFFRVELYLKLHAPTSNPMKLPGHGDPHTSKSGLVAADIENIAILCRHLHHRPSQAEQAQRACRREHTLQPAPWLAAHQTKLASTDARFDEIDVYIHEVPSRATSAEVRCCI